MTSLGPAPAPWRIRSRERVYSSPHLSIERRICETPTGVFVDAYEVVETPDWVGVVAVTDEGRIVLENVYREPVGHVLTELPAGRIDPDDPSPEEAGRRELREETGYEIEGPLVRLLAVHPSTGRMPGRAFGVLGFGARKVAAPTLEPYETLTVFEADIAEAIAAWFADPEPIAGVHLLFALAAVRWIGADTTPERAALRARLRAAGLAGVWSGGL